MTSFYFVGTHWFIPELTFLDLLSVFVARCATKFWQFWKLQYAKANEATSFEMFKTNKTGTERDSQGNSCQGLQKYQASSRCLTKWNTNGSFGLEAFRPIQMSESVVLKGDVFKVQISCCETIRPRANSQVFIWMQLSCGLLKILAISLYHTLFRPIPKSM